MAHIVATDFWVCYQVVQVYTFDLASTMVYLCVCVHACVCVWLFINFLSKMKRFDNFNIQGKSNPAKITNVYRVRLPAYSSGFRNIMENYIILAVLI